MDRRYEEPERVGLDEACDAFRSGNPDEIVRGLIGLALSGQEPSSALLWCLFFVRDPDHQVAAAAAISIGHLARIHKQIDKAVVIPVLQMIRDEGRIAGEAGDALDDIAVFCSK